jgi:mitochondrial fission protein ELM1
MRMAAASGGSVFATTSRRLGAAATEAFCAAVQGAAHVHRWAPDDDDNPYLGFLALADAFVITGDSESMLAEVATLGRPVYIATPPVRASFRVLRFFREWVVARAQARPRTARGTVRPQRALTYGCARLIDRGFVRPTRDLDRLHEELIRMGVARRLGEAYAPAAAAPPRHREAVAERVRELMGVGSP